MMDKSTKIFFISTVTVLIIIIIIFGFSTYFSFKYENTSNLTNIQQSILTLSKVATAYFPFVIQSVTLILLIGSMMMTSKGLQAQLTDLKNKQIPNVIIQQTTLNTELDVLDIKVVNIGSLLAYDLEVSISKDFYDIINQHKTSELIEPILSENSAKLHDIRARRLMVSPIAQKRVERRSKVFREYEKLIVIPSKAITCFPDSPIHIQFPYDPEYFDQLKTYYVDKKIRIVITLRYKADINDVKYIERKIPTILYE